MDYASLVTLIKKYTSNEETSFNTHIPDFVRAAEARIYNSVLIPILRKNAVGSLTPGVKYLSLPADWLATYSVALIIPATETQIYLLNKDVEFIRESFPTPTVTGIPSHYAQFDVDSIILGPTPDLAYNVELHYFYYPESIVTATTSWVGDNFENVLLYGSLREAYLYMKGEPDIIAEYEKKYQEDLLLLKKLGEVRNQRDFYRASPPRPLQ